MIKKISKHIKWGLHDKKYDDDYKQEMINACIEEYKKALKNGLSKNDAYLYAIKDFDNEYYKERIDSENNKINIKNLYLPLSVTIIFIISFLLCTQFISDKVFVWSIWVFLIFNFLFLFIYNIFNLIIKKYGIKTALLNILFMIILYFPFILIELKGNRYDFNNYIIAFAFCITLGIIFYTIKNKFINFTLSLLLLIPLLIIFGYYVIFSELYTIEFILKLLIMISFIVVCILSLIKEKLNCKKIFFSIIFLVLSLLIFFFLDDAIQIYSKYTVLSFILIIALLVLKFLNIKIIKDYSFIIYVFVFFACVKVICSDINIVYRNGLMSTLNYQFLVSAVIFLVLILLQKYLYKIKCRKEFEN